MDARDVILARKLGGGSGGGGGITDGIVIKARDAAGYATEADVYIGSAGFANCGCGTAYNVATPFYKLAAANIMGKPSFLPERVFQNCQVLSTIVGDFSEVADIRGSAFYGCKLLSTPLSFPKFTGITDNDIRFQNCINLPSVQLGSIGYGITSFRNTFFSNCSQSALTVTAYTSGDFVDEILPKIRNGATNATIIIKASEGTTYNGASYAAGETLITSTIEEVTA